MTVSSQSGWSRRTWSAAVTPAMPCPMTTTRRTAGSKRAAGAGAARAAARRCGVSETVTGPFTRAQQASRVLSARPRRASVARSSSPSAEMFPMPSRIATGSAPQIPIRQPDSSVRPHCSAIASSVWPGSMATRLPSGLNDTCARSRVAAFSSAIAAPSPSRAAGALAVATESATKRRSTSSVRASQTTVTASTAPRMTQPQSGAGVVPARAPTAPTIVSALNQ